MLNNINNNPSSSFPILESLVAALSVFIGLYFCINRLDVFLFGDEFHSLRTIGLPYAKLMTVYKWNGSGTALPLMQRFAVQIFGPGLLAYRLPAFLGAIATLLLMFPAASSLVGPTPAAIATLALSLNSMHIFYSGFARSYTLMIFFALLTVYSAKMATSRDKPQPIWFVIFALSSGLLPYIHTSASAFVALIGISAVVMTTIEKKTTHVSWIIGSLIFGAIICISLHLPVLKQVFGFIQNRSGQGNISKFSCMDVISLLSGGRAAAYVWLVGISVSSVWFVFQKRARALLLITAALPLFAILFAVRPFGMAYAYARYLLCALPFILMLMAWLLVNLVNRMELPQAAAKMLALFAGIFLVAASFITGPLGLKHVSDGPFANTYLSMMPLPAFDKPWDKTPLFYKSLTDFPEPIQIIEAPALFSRSVQLYRNYYLQHKKKVIIGFASSNSEHPAGGPYVSLDKLQSVKKSGSDYLILHFNITEEVEQYWDFVYKKVWPIQMDKKIKSLMFSQKKFNYKLKYGDLSLLAEDLQNRLGVPVYRDKWIAAWDLRS